MSAVANAVTRMTSGSISDGVEPGAAVYLTVPLLIAVSRPSPSTLARHAQVGHDDVERWVERSTSSASRPVVRGPHLVTGAPQADREKLAHRLLVVDDEDPAHGGHYGIMTPMFATSYGRS